MGACAEVVIEGMLDASGAAVCLLWVRSHELCAPRQQQQRPGRIHRVQALHLKCTVTSDFGMQAIKEATAGASQQPAQPAR